MAHPISRVVPFLLVTVACVFAVEMGYQGFEWFLDRSMKPKASVAVVQDVDIPAEQKGEEEFAVDHSIIVQRNLFGSSAFAEQGDKGGADEEQPLEKTDKELVLMGTVNTAGEANGSRAIVLNLKGGKQQIFQVGDALEGAVIEQIKRGQVVLEVDGKKEVMDMTDAAQHRTPAPVQPDQNQGGGVQEERDGRGQAVAATPGQAQVRRREVRPRTVRPARRVIPRRTRPVTND